MVQNHPLCAILRTYGIFLYSMPLIMHGVPYVAIARDICSVVLHCQPAIPTLFEMFQNPLFLSNK